MRKFVLCLLLLLSGCFCSCKKNLKLADNTEESFKEIKLESNSFDFIRSNDLTGIYFNKNSKIIVESEIKKLEN